MLAGKGDRFRLFCKTRCLRVRYQRFLAEMKEQGRTNCLEQSAPISAFSTADLLQNRVEIGGADVEKRAVCLQKQIGLMGSVSLIVGTMIGSGIFASASGVFINAGSPGLTLIVWAGCGVIAMLGALCYVELGTAILKSGAEFTYILEAFGGLAAFLFSWTSVTLLRPSQMAIIALAFGQYVVEPFFPACQGSDRQDLNILVKLLAAFCLGKGFQLFLFTIETQNLFFQRERRRLVNYVSEI